MSAQLLNGIFQFQLEHLALQSFPIPNLDCGFIRRSTFMLQVRIKDTVRCSHVRKKIQLIKNYKMKIIK